MDDGGPAGHGRGTPVLVAAPSYPLEYWSPTRQSAPLPGFWEVPKKIKIKIKKP